eukprot:GFUD01107631.1.p1 GENE.GFUD01107631.1~~GFUD01107631.1.p1  ORF type:complete len:633 (+),score=229.92 GFUD01107631.1:164-1900(+)
MEINITEDREAVKHAKATLKSKRPAQSIDEIKKNAKQKKEKASELAKDLEEKVEIAGKAAKIKAALGSLKSFPIFSPQHPSQQLQQSQPPEEERLVCVPRVKIDKLMVPDLVLSASDFAEVGRGRNLLVNSGVTGDITVNTGDTSRPSVLPAFHDDLVVHPPSTSSISDSPKPRVAYTPGMAGMQHRKRTLSESTCLQDPVLKSTCTQSKRGRQTPEVTSELQSVDEAMGQLMDKQRVKKLKKSLLKMNMNSLKELVNNPTSSKSRLLMSALVQDHRSLISNCLNRARFCRDEAVEGEKKNDALEDELEALPNKLMVEISDMIKQEVPDIEIIIELGGNSGVQGVKQELDQEFGPLDLNVKCEVEYGQEQWSEEQSELFKKDMNKLAKVNEEDPEQEEVVKVPVLPGTPPPCIDLVKIEIDAVGSRSDIQAEFAEDSTSKSHSLSKVGGTSDPIGMVTRLAPVPKKKGRPCKGQERRMGGQEVIIGTVGDFISVQGYETTETDNDSIEEVEQEDVEKKNKSNDSNKMNSLGLIFDQESRLLYDIESVDSKMSSLAQERSSLVQQLLFLSELKRQIFKQ